MRILVTGASGLLGLNLAIEAANLGRSARGGRLLEADGRPGFHQVYGVVNRHKLQTRIFQVVEVDLLAAGALERLLDEVQPDWVINCAALAVVDACEANPDLAHRLNVELPAKLAEHVARGGARLVHISTDAVFDGIRGGYTEDDTPNPLSVYARTKLAGERAVAEMNPEAIVARVNLFGWSLGGQRSLAEFFFYQLQAGTALQGFTDVFFCPLLVNDLAHILLEMLSHDLHGLYHAVSSECTSKYEFGVRLARQFGLDERLISPTSVEEAGLKAARSPRLTLRSDKLAEALGAPLPSLSPALERFSTLYQQNYPQGLKRLGDSE